MKAFLISWLAEAVFDEVMKALAKIAHRSDNNVDDKLIRVLKSSRSDIIKEIKAKI